MSQVVLKFGAFSNINYKHEWETGMAREEWDALTEKERKELYEEALWSDIDCWDEDES